MASRRALRNYDPRMMDTSVPRHLVTVCARHALRRAVAELLGVNVGVELAVAGAIPKSREATATWAPPRPHMDGDYPVMMPNGWVAGAILFLTPVGSQEGAFLAYPGSHLRQRTRAARLPGGLRGGTPLDEAGPFEEVLVQAGDVVLFHPLLVHSGSPNRCGKRSRLALHSWWCGRARVVPGGKPFAAMSTIEKGWSPRYLESRFGVPRAIPACTPGPRQSLALHRGIGTKRAIAAYTLLNRGDHIERLVVEKGGPPKAGVVRSDVSRDLVSWRTIDRVLCAPASIRSLAHFEWGDELILAVASREGLELRVRDGSSGAFSRRAVVPNATCGCPHFNVNAVNSTRFAAGAVLFFVTREDGARVRCRWGATWDRLDAGEVVAAEACPGVRIIDVQVRPVNAGTVFAMIADFETKEGSHPAYVLSDDSALYTGSFRPLRFDVPVPPRRLRVVARAQGYWLVSYLRCEGGSVRMFWGELDWERKPIAVREIRSASALRDAFHVTGLR